MAAVSTRENGKPGPAHVGFGIGSSNYFNLPFWVAQHTGLFDQYGVCPEPDVYHSIEEADAGLRSESEGEEPNRRVVVFPAQ